MSDNLSSLRDELTLELLTSHLATAGQVVYYNEAMNAFILGVRVHGAEQFAEVAVKAWDSISGPLKDKLTKSGIGFAVERV